MIRSLLYLTASRPDILFSVCLYARFQSDPREFHLTVVKRIFRYLKATTILGLLYRKSLYYQLVGFCDADHAGDRIERKSTSRNYQFLGENLISWASKRQATIVMSTVEAEYISAASCCTKLLWMKHQLEVQMKHQLEDYQINANIFPFFGIILLLFVCQRIQFYIQEPSILRSNTILSKTMFKKEFQIYNSLTLKINGLIYLLSL